MRLRFSSSVRLHSAHVLNIKTHYNCIKRVHVDALNDLINFAYQIDISRFKNLCEAKILKKEKKCSEGCIYLIKNTVKM